MWKFTPPTKELVLGLELKLLDLVTGTFAHLSAHFIKYFYKDSRGWGLS